MVPVRLIKNEFYKQVEDAYLRQAEIPELKELLGRGRAKKGMFEGDLVEGELEIGQISGIIDEILPAAKIVEEIITDFKKSLAEQQTNSKFQF